MPVVAPVVGIGSWISTANASPFNGNWQGMAFGNDTFVTVGYNSSVAISSTDGLSWTQRTLPNSSTWYHVAYGAGKFVAIAGDSTTWGRTATSTDGITWSAGTSIGTYNWRQLRYVNGYFVTPANNTTRFAYSTDAVTWAQSTALPQSVSWQNVAYGNGVYVMAVQNQTYCATSTDLVSWTQTTVTSSGGGGQVAFGNGIFVLGGNTGSSHSDIYYSTDATTWSTATLPASQSWQEMIYGNGYFIVASTTATNSAISADGINWSSRSAGPGKQPGYGNSRYVAVNGTTGWKQNFGVPNPSVRAPTVVRAATW